VDGSIDKCKGCLVTKGFNQIDEVDYEETFSAVAIIAFIRLPLALISHLDLKLFQMDVKIDFLNGNL